MEAESDATDNINVNMFGDRGSVERIKSDYGALRCILSKMEFDDLLQARLVCRNWKKESDFFIRRRIKSVDITTDCRLKEYLKSDRSVYPSINLDVGVGGLSTKVLAKCDLKGVQELLIKTTGPKRNGRVIRASDIWIGYLKDKFMKLFQQENILTSLHIDLTYPITFSRKENDFLRNFANIRCLSFIKGEYWNKWDIKNFEVNGIGSILVTRCPSIQYLTMEVKCGNLTFNHLLNMLIERMEHGHEMPILSLHPLLRVFPDNFGPFIQFVNLGLRIEILELCIFFENEQRFDEVIRATEKLLQNTADFLRELKLAFFIEVENIVSQPRINIPSLPKIQNLEIGVEIEGVNAFQCMQLPDKFPRLKKLQFLSNWKTFFISGKVFSDLDKLVIGCDDFFYIPDSPPEFPCLRAIDFIYPVRQEFLQFAFNYLTSVREMRIILPIIYHSHEEYFDVWNIFTGGVQPPAHVLPSPNRNNRGMDEVENDAPGQVANVGNPVNDEVNVNDGNPALMEPLVASLQNFTNLRELVLDWAVPRDIQAVTYMTQFNKMQMLDKLRIRTFQRDTKFKDFRRCLRILRGYHCLVEIY